MAGNTNILIGVLAALVAVIVVLLIICVILVRKHLKLRKKPYHSSNTPDDMALQTGTLTMLSSQNNNDLTRQLNSNGQGASDNQPPTYAQVDKGKKQTSQEQANTKPVNNQPGGYPENENLYANADQEQSQVKITDDDKVEYSLVDAKSFVPIKQTSTREKGSDLDEINLTYAELDLPNPKR